MNAVNWINVFVVTCALVGCKSGEKFHTKTAQQHTAGVAGMGTVSDTNSPSLVAQPSTGGASAMTSGIAGQSTGGNTSTAGTSSTSTQATGGKTSTTVSTGGSNSTGGASASTGGLASTGGASSTSTQATGGSFVGVSISVPATTVTYVVRYTIEDPVTMWPVFQLTYYNRQNFAATIQTIYCLDMPSEEGMECRFSVNQALSWELNVCLDQSCTWTLPSMDSSGDCTIKSGLRVYRANSAGLTEIGSRLALNQTGTNCNLVIEPGGLAPVNTLDSDGDGSIDSKDCMQFNPSAHPKRLASDREICWNDLDEDCNGAFDNGDCVNTAPPANGSTVSQTERVEVHQILPNAQGKSFDSKLFDQSTGTKIEMRLIQTQPVYKEWPCGPASVADPKTGTIVLGIECPTQRDPKKPFNYQVQVGSVYMMGYSDKCATSSAIDCAHTPEHSLRDYVRVGNIPYAGFADVLAGYPRTIVLSYVSDRDTAEAILPAE